MQPSNPSASRKQMGQRGHEPGLFLLVLSLGSFGSGECLGFNQNHGGYEYSCYPTCLISSLLRSWICRTCRRVSDDFLG
jgi:hypothetical protein